MSLPLSPIVKAEITEDLPLKGERPLYELGLGAGTGFLPHYPASDQGKWRTLALPTFVYRGSFLRADEEDGVRAKLLSGPRFGIELSGAGALPAPSKENSARGGMPDLDLLGEMGPQLYLRIQKHGVVESRLLFPLRVAASSDLKRVDWRGYTFSPGFDIRFLLPKTYGAIRFKANALFGSEDYQEYFYDVSPRYATPDRPAYSSSGGYVGTYTDLGYSAEWKRWAVFIQVGYNNFQNARNRTSPLFKSEHNMSGIAGVRWLLYQSDEKENARP